jgi:hypothetical protein
MCKINMKSCSFACYFMRMGNLDLRCKVRAWIEDVSKQIDKENVLS